MTEIAKPNHLVMQAENSQNETPASLAYTQ